MGTRIDTATTVQEYLDLGQTRQLNQQICQLLENNTTMNYSNKASFANVIQDKGSDPTIISRRASTVNVPSVIISFNEGATDAVPNRLTLETVNDDKNEGNRVEMRLFYTDSVYQGNGHSTPMACSFHQWINTYELEQLSEALIDYLANHKAYVKLEQAVEKADEAIANDSRKSINF